MSYDGKKNESNYDDQLKFYAIYNDGTSSLINIWREEKSAPVVDSEDLS